MKKKNLVEPGTGRKDGAGTAERRNLLKLGSHRSARYLKESTPAGGRKRRRKKRPGATEDERRKERRVDESAEEAQ